MKKAKKVIFVVVGVLVVLLLTCWFTFFSPPMFFIQMTLPDNAKNLPWDFEEGSRIFNQRIQSQYKNGMDALELTSRLQEEGYEVLIVADQEKEVDKPYCAITWWDVFISENRLQRNTGNLDSHNQICSKTRQMHAEYVEGTSLQALTKQLQEDDFEVSMTAKISRNKFPCSIYWEISWSEDELLQANDIKANFRYNCM